MVFSAASLAAINLVSSQTASTSSRRAASSSVLLGDKVAKRPHASSAGADGVSRMDGVGEAGNDMALAGSEA